MSAVNCTAAVAPTAACSQSVQPPFFSLHLEFGEGLLSSSTISALENLVSQAKRTPEQRSPLEQLLQFDRKAPSSQGFAGRGANLRCGASDTKPLETLQVQARLRAKIRN